MARRPGYAAAPRELRRATQGRQAISDRLSASNEVHESQLARKEEDEDGLRFFGSDGVLTFELNTETGDAYFRGRVESATIVSSSVWMPNDDTSVNRTRLADTISAGVGGIFYYKADETDYRGYVTVGETNVTAKVTDPAPSNKKEASTDLRSDDGTYGPGWFLFARRAADGGANAICWINEPSGQTWGELHGIHRARDLIQAGSVNVSTSASVNGSAAVTYPQAFPSTPFVTHACNGSNSVLFNTGTTSLGSTGFTAQIRHNDNVSLTSLTIAFHWTAVTADA